MQGYDKSLLALMLHMHERPMILLDVMISAS